MALRNAHPGGGKGSVSALGTSFAKRSGQGSKQSVAPPSGRGGQSAGSTRATSPQAGDMGVPSGSRSVPVGTNTDVGNSSLGINGHANAEALRRNDGDGVHPNRGANAHPY